MEVKVLGPGCAKCKTTYNVILSTPAVVVDGEVKIKGRVPNENEVKELFGL